MSKISKRYFIVIIFLFTMIYIIRATSVNVYAEIPNSAVSNPRVEDEDGITYGHDTIKSTWDCIYFGSYYQSNGETKEPIKWRVLSVDGNKALIVADKILNCMPYCTEQRAVSWADSNVRYWLNNNFYDDAFSSEEKTVIVDTTIQTAGGDDTQDNVFILSQDDLQNGAYGFPSSGYTFSRAAKLTEYARSLGAQENQENNTKEYYGYSWVRTTSNDPNSENYNSGISVWAGGGFYSEPVTKTTVGVRPAIIIDLTANNWRNAGTIMMNGAIGLSPNMCGENLYCQLKEDGQLIIEGTGEMTGSPWSNQVKSITSIEMPEGMTSIYKNAFKDCDQLTEVFFPSSLKTIGEGAFKNSWITGKLSLPEGLLSIEKNAFEKCELITEIVLPSTLQTIGECAFEDCTGLKPSLTIDNSFLEIGPSAFWGCTKLKDVNINAKTLGSLAFGNDINITNVVLSDNLVSIGDGAFFGCPNIKNLQYSNNTAFEFTKGSTSAFYNSSTIDTITVTGTGTYNGAEVITNSSTFVETPLAVCKENVKAVYLNGNITSIRTSAFSGCTNLETILLSDSITSIGESVFKDCVSLNSINYPNNMTIIPSNTFSGCTSLQEIDIPESVKEIGENAFYNCSGMKVMTLPSKIAKIDTGAYMNCTGIEYIFFPDSIMKIDDNAFDGCSKLSKAVFCGDAPINFGSNVFNNCATEFSIIYPEDAEDWSTPLWGGYPASSSGGIDPDGHVWKTEYDVDVEATCSKEGSESIHCLLCDTIKEGTSRTIQKTEHVYGEWITTKEVTCTEDGSKEKICAACGDKIIEAISSTGHSWNTKATVDKAATCTEEGSQSIHCSVCGIKDETTVMIIPATGHKWNSTYTEDKKASYASEGSKSIHCSVCGEIQPDSEITIPKLKVKVPTLSKPKAIKKGFTVKWKKVSIATGYEVQYALNSKFTKSKKTVKINKAGTVSKKISKLKAKKKYYIRIRVYKVVSGKTYYSTWCKAKTVITKK